jgi:hypothetical protein
MLSIDRVVPPLFPPHPSVPLYNRTIVTIGPGGDNQRGEIPAASLRCFHISTPRPGRNGLLSASKAAAIRKSFDGPDFAVDFPVVDTDFLGVFLPLPDQKSIVSTHPAHDSPSLIVTRASIQQSIEFRGLIEGCADHQWLLTDALYHSGETPPTDDTPRWIIRSELVKTPSSPEQNKLRNHFVAHDREAGWTLTASSASDLAGRIRQKCAESNASSPPS